MEHHRKNRKGVIVRTSGVAWCVTVVAAASLGLVACSSGANSGSAGGGSTAGKKYTIGVSFDLLNAIRQAEKSSIQSAAEAAGYSVVFDVADQDAQKQASQIQDLI